MRNGCNIRWSFSACHKKTLSFLTKWIYHHFHPLCILKILSTGFCRFKSTLNHEQALQMVIVRTAQLRLNMEHQMNFPIILGPTPKRDMTNRRPRPEVILMLNQNQCSAPSIRRTQQRFALRCIHCIYFAISPSPSPAIGFHIVDAKNPL